MTGRWETKLFVPGYVAVWWHGPDSASGWVRSRGQADAGVRPGRVRQDHGAGGVAGRQPLTDRWVAWLSLDAADNEPASFWTYVVTALRRRSRGSAPAR